MKKIITAIGNENINNELKKEKNIEIIINDIQYKEGIIEILEKYQEVDYIILDSSLQGDITTEELIKQINIINKNIKIIIISENNLKTLEEFINKKIIYKIIYNNKNEEINLQKIIGAINNNEINDNLNKNNNEESKEKINNSKKIIFEKDENKKIKLNSNKTICITGPPGVGKTIISINLAKINIYQKNKILIIDSDFFNNSISTILGVKNQVSNNILENNIIKLNNDFLDDFNFIKINKKINLLVNNKKINKNNYYILNVFLENINHLKNIYDLIIIDTNCNEDLNNLKEIIKISDKCLFVSDTNLLEINKSIKLLDKFINNINIEINKINLIFNKYNSESISFKLLKNIFNEFNIIGKINYSEKYNKLINKNNKYNLINKKIRKEYLKINYKIIGGNYYGVRKQYFFNKQFNRRKSCTRAK